MKTYRLRRDAKSVVYLWAGPGIMLVTAGIALAWVMSGAGQRYPQVHVGSTRVWVVWFAILAWNSYFLNGRIVRELRVTPDGTVDIVAPLYRRAVPAESVQFLGPAFSKNFLELRYAGGRSILLDNMNDLEDFELAIKERSSTFRGRRWPDA